MDNQKELEDAIERKKKHKVASNGPKSPYWQLYQDEGWWYELNKSWINSDNKIIADAYIEKIEPRIQVAMCNFCKTTIWAGQAYFSIQNVGGEQRFYHDNCGLIERAEKAEKERDSLLIEVEELKERLLTGHWEVYES